MKAFLRFKKQDKHLDNLRVLQNCNNNRLTKIYSPCKWCTTHSLKSIWLFFISCTGRFLCGMSRQVELRINMEYIFTYIFAFIQWEYIFNRNMYSRIYVEYIFLWIVSRIKFLCGMSGQMESRIYWYYFYVEWLSLYRTLKDNT